MTASEVREFIDTVIYDKAVLFSHDRVHRLFLRRPTSAPNPQYNICMFIGANPSKADEYINDLTVTKATKWASIWGFKWMWMLNLKAVVMTDPELIGDHPDPIGLFNDLWIVECARQADRIICAYGDLGKDRSKEVECKLLNAGLKDKLMCFGVTQSGYPKHPSRIAYSTPLVPYLGGQ